MKVIELTAPRLDAFRPAIRPDPIPAYGEVLVRLRGAALNFLDLAVATGKYPLSRFPIIPVTDGAGEVVALGQSVTSWKLGDRVIPHFIPDWQDGRMPAVGGGPRRGIDLQGSLAELVVVQHTPSFARLSTYRTQRPLRYLLRPLPRGAGCVLLPFDALNRDFRYQLTVVGEQFAQARVASKMANRSFVIKNDKPNVENSWQVTGIRQDAWAKCSPHSCRGTEDRYGEGPLSSP